MPAFAAISVLLQAAAALETRQCSGLKVGEPTPMSAIVWMRLTATSQRASGTSSGRHLLQNDTWAPDDGAAALPLLSARGAAGSNGTSKLKGACPGAAGTPTALFSTDEPRRL
jgi:hypothetical protein